MEPEHVLSVMSHESLLPWSPLQLESLLPWLPLRRAVTMVTIRHCYYGYRFVIVSNPAHTHSTSVYYLEKLFLKKSIIA